MTSRSGVGRKFTKAYSTKRRRISQVHYVWVRTFVGISCRVRKPGLDLTGGLGGLDPLAHNANPPAFWKFRPQGGRIIQACNPPVQYFQHILTSIFVYVGQL